MALSVLAGIAKLAYEGFNKGYQIYQDQRNFNEAKRQYDKAVDMENTAIQRRVNDAVKAGINPYNAIGAGAGAGVASGSVGGSTVSNSELPVGSFFDLKHAENQLQTDKEAVKQMQEQTKQAEYETDIKKNEKEQSDRTNDLSGREYEFLTNPDWFTQDKFPAKWTPYQMMLNSKLNQQVAESNIASHQDKISQVDADMAKPHAFLDMISSGIGSALGIKGLLKKGIPTRK